MCSMQFCCCDGANERRSGSKLARNDTRVPPERSKRRRVGNQTRESHDGRNDTGPTAPAAPLTHERPHYQPPPHSAFSVRKRMQPPRFKAVFFDMGGVCVHSPLEGIRSFERQKGMPENYLNVAMYVPSEVVGLQPFPLPNPRVVFKSLPSCVSPCFQARGEPRHFALRSPFPRAMSRTPFSHASSFPGVFGLNHMPNFPPFVLLAQFKASMAHFKV